MDIYLDNAATTRVYKEVSQEMEKIFREEYGNPSSLHLKGFQAEKLVRNSRKIIANVLKAREKEIVFTSGGTESNNLAILGVARGNKRSGNHIITSEIEHPSVFNPIKQLEEEGFLVTILPVNDKGEVEPEKLRESITKETILVSIMHVNNETGSLQRIEELGNIIKETNPSTLFHVDGVQSFGKYVVNPRKMNIDLFSASGHKIHAPKGIGFLYIKSGIKINPLILGGGQENGLRSGTENVPGIVGLGEAVRIIYDKYDKNNRHMMELKSYFVKNVCEIDESFVIPFLHPFDGAPHIVSCGFQGIRSEVLLHALEEKNIYISSGSACSSSKKETSRSLKALGLRNDMSQCVVRFSFSEFTTIHELKTCIDELKEITDKLRKYKHY